MKPFLAVAALFVTLAAYGQSNPSNDSMQSQIRQRLARRPGETYFVVRSEKPNEIKRNGVAYSGILVQLTKTDNPLQLVNPAARAEYGSSEDNLIRESRPGHEGLKLFSISF